MSGSFFSLGRLVVLGGLFLIIIGLLMMAAGKFFNLGRLPGDIFIQRGNFSLYFPLVSSIILSLVLTVILNIVLRR
ncbi:MAG: DUF2905 domain-containing protein [Desulfocucumaceae bacterium]